MTDQDTAAGPRNLPALLVGLRERRFTGAVTVSGTPGGTIHVRDGLVVAIHTPGAPAPDALLLRSRRVGEDEWNAALEAGRGDGRPDAALVALGTIGAGELDAVCRASVFDGAFAMSLSPSAEWTVDEAVPTPAFAADVGVEPQPLADETARRMLLLSGLWGPLGEFAGSRIKPAPRVEMARVPMVSRFHDVLAAANGRRGPRDIAFALGRGVYAVMLDLARMHERRLVQRDVPSGAGPVPILTARMPGDSGPAPDVDHALLPRRSPGTHRPGPVPVVTNGQDQVAPGTPGGTTASRRTQP